MNNYELLIVEDDHIFTWMQSKLVKKSTLHSGPLTFTNGKEAIEYLDEHAANLPSMLVLLDINMPVLNGWQFLEELQTKPYSSRVRVVMLTSSVETSDKEKSETYPQVIGYYEKPLSLEICAEIKSVFLN